MRLPPHLRAVAMLQAAEYVARRIAEENPDRSVPGQHRTTFASDGAVLARADALLTRIETDYSDYLHEESRE